jgi:hypothetical protein
MWLQVCVPLLDMVKVWLFEGRIDDPGREFFIVHDEGVRFSNETGVPPQYKAPGRCCVAGAVLLSQHRCFACTAALQSLLPNVQLGRDAAFDHHLESPHAFAERGLVHQKQMSTRC